MSTIAIDPYCRFWRIEHASEIVDDMMRIDLWNISGFRLVEFAKYTINAKVIFADNDLVRLDLFGCKPFVCFDLIVETEDSAVIFDEGIIGLFCFVFCFEVFQHAIDQIWNQDLWTIYAYLETCGLEDVGVLGYSMPTISIASVYRIGNVYKLFGF